jgi:hypothetical protein
VEVVAVVAYRHLWLVLVEVAVLVDLELALA